MESMSAFTILGVIAAIILQVIMIIKFFQMAKDIRSMKEVSFEEYQERHYPKWDEDKSPYAEVKLPRYEIAQGEVLFGDRKQGCIYQDFGTFSFVDNKSKQVFCYSQLEAIRGLYQALVLKDE